MVVVHATVGADELAALFRGDDLSCGYAHRSLIVALCRSWKPVNEGSLRQKLYPKLGEEDIDSVALEELRAGFKQWHEGGRK